MESTTARLLSESTPLAEVLPPHDPRELDGLLADRTRVPLDKIDDLIRRTPSEARQDVAAMSSMLRRFAEAVIEAFDDPSATDDFLRELDLSVISRDHDWRRIFAEIRASSAGDVESRRCLLLRYLEYLSFRKRLIEFLHANAAGLAETAEHIGLDAVPGRSGRTDADSGADERSDPMWWEDPAFARLTMGTSVTVRLEHGMEIPLIMGGHRGRLCGSVRPLLHDLDGTTHVVKPGRNVVGRHPRCDVVLKAGNRLVSRVHLVLSWDGVGQFTILDLSSKGTFLPVEFVA